MPAERSRNILCIGETWFGSDARAAFAALRRAGHSIHVIDESHFVPTEWTSFGARLLRKSFRQLMVNELTRHVVEMMNLLEPEVLFVFKGNYVSPHILRAARLRRVLSVNYYPDVSFFTHGRQLPLALPLYDHVFNAKTFGVSDMRAHGVRSVSFLAPGFDPELHRPVQLTSAERARLGCDVSFIGTWSPTKEALLAALSEAMPSMKLRIWGNQWDKRRTRSLDRAVAGCGIHGEAYARAISASSICLGLLSEARTGSSSGDLITARTFQIPACGTFLLHERNDEVAQYFAEGREAEFFDGVEELVAKIKRYLDQPAERSSVAHAGFKRSIESDYSIDSRMREAAAFMSEKLG